MAEIIIGIGNGTDLTHSHYKLKTAILWPLHNSSRFSQVQAEVDIFRDLKNILFWWQQFNMYFFVRLLAFFFFFIKTIYILLAKISCYICMEVVNDTEVPSGSHCNNSPLSNHSSNYSPYKFSFSTCTNAVIYLYLGEVLIFFCLSCGLLTPLPPTPSCLYSYQWQKIILIQLESMWAGWALGRTTSCN